MKNSLFQPLGIVYGTILIISITLLAALKTATYTNACPKTKRAKPNMWVARDEGIGYENNFTTKQHKQLSDQMHGDETSSIIYPIAGFREMINMVVKSKYKFLQVYIVAYDSGSDVPLQLQGKLTLLFHPAIDSAEEQPPYYTIAPDGTIAEEKNADRYKAEYAKYKLPLLTKNIDSSIPDNVSSSGIVSDTKKVTYDSSDIADLIREVAYQLNTNKISTDGIKAIFSSYSPTGHPVSHKYANRIFVLYEFFTNVGGKLTVYYIDDQKDFCYRKDPVKPNNGNTLAPKSSKIYSVDNGHLCPPGCP